MKISFKIRYIITAVFFVFFVAVNAQSAQKTTNNYAYIQINQMHNIFSEVRDTSWVPDIDRPGVLNQTNNLINFGFFDPSFLSNFTFGFMWTNYGVELEYVSYDMFANKINGKLAGSADGVFSNLRIEYIFANFRQDFWEYKDINVFYKIGFGVVEPNFASSGNDGGSEMEIGLQGSLGAYYALNDFVDFEVFYKVLGNYARRRESYAASFEKKVKFLENSINWGLRFKLHSYSKKDISVY